MPLIPELNAWFLQFLRTTPTMQLLQICASIGHIGGVPCIWLMLVKFLQSSANLRLNWKRTSWKIISITKSYGKSSKPLLGANQLWLLKRLQSICRSLLSSSSSSLPSSSSTTITITAELTGAVCLRDPFFTPLNTSPTRWVPFDVAVVTRYPFELDPPTVQSIRYHTFVQLVADGFTAVV